MRSVRVFVALVLSQRFGHASPASAAKSLSATLSGANEIPSDSGDQDGTGPRALTLKKKKRTLCWTITHDKIAAPNGGTHPHRWPNG